MQTLAPLEPEWILDPQGVGREGSDGVEGKHVFAMHLDSALSITILAKCPTRYTNLFSTLETALNSSKHGG